MKTKPKKQPIDLLEIVKKMAQMQNEINELKAKPNTCPFPHYPPCPNQTPVMPWPPIWTGTTGSPNLPPNYWVTY